MKKKTLKKWTNILMRASVEKSGLEDTSRKVNYISSKQLKRMISNKAFKDYFKKYKGITFHDIDHYLTNNECNENDESSRMIFDERTYDYILKDHISIFDYILIVDNPSIEYLHITKNRKFYLEIDPINKTAEIVMVYFI